MGGQNRCFNFNFHNAKKILFVLGSIFLLNASSAQSPLEPHRWQDRVILLFAPAQDHVFLQQQYTLLTAEMEKVTDRDLVFYQVFSETGLAPNEKPLPKEAVRALRERFEVSAAQFAIILVGKDGTEKLRREEVIKPKEIFDLIDTMPMRRAEMRRDSSN